ncbi:hypothetical protein [Shewanella surugensis]|uniref:Uncharacterized protein n=1 Tax=Shewanella surugensis TaxID=212020 RepID=A0ABT0LFQ0_9GAMM|nr:hypothetical protein [Shewanella surugensis]MCL1126518.1 hypothetical protein [Shewanella surugensis]
MKNVAKYCILPVILAFTAISAQASTTSMLRCAPACQTHQSSYSLTANNSPAIPQLTTQGSIGGFGNNSPAVPSLTGGQPSPAVPSLVAVNSSAPAVPSLTGSQPSPAIPSLYHIA